MERVLTATTTKGIGGKRYMQQCSILLTGRCPPTPYIIILNRNFRSTATAHASPRDATTSLPKKTKSVVKKVNKKCSELPNAYLLPDGKPAKPLGPWQGQSDPLGVRSSVDGLTSSKLSLPLSEVQSAPKRRRRKTAVDISGTAFSAKVAVDDLVGGVPAKHESVSAEDDNAEARLKPRSLLAREISENIQRFPHCLLLTRVGSFYESYFDQANEIANLLSIKLTSRKWNGSRIPMCGFPLIHLDKHLNTLVSHHKRFVAMCEEFPRFTEFGGKEYDRRVTRIITPGTLIDEPFLNTSENNYLLSIDCPSSWTTEGLDSSSLGLAWIDISTGEFYSKACSINSLQDELARIGPHEVVLDAPMKTLSSHPVLDVLKEEGLFFTFSKQSISRSIEGTPHLDGSTSSASAEASAVSLLSHYLHSNLLENAPSLGSPLHEIDSTRMHIDAHTIKSLEIRETGYDGGTKGSLLSVIKRTTTSSGTRLLSRRLCSPSASLPEIQKWQCLVALFFNRPHLRTDLIEILKDAGDVGRIVQRFLLGRGEIADLFVVKRTIDIWTSVVRRLHLERDLEGEATSRNQWESVESLTSHLVDFTSLSGRIQNALLPQCLGLHSSGDSDMLANDQIEGDDSDAWLDAPSSWKWVINPQFSSKLSSLHATLKSLRLQRDDLEMQLRKQYDAPSLSLRSSAGQGMHIHLARAKRDHQKISDDPAFTKIAESAATKSYLYQPWSQLGGLIGSAVLSLAAAEKEAFEGLRNEVVSHASGLKTNASVLDELDVAIGFASLAKELNFVQPTITGEYSYHVINGRHPSVEMGLFSSGRTFTPNTIEMGPSSNMHIITGPNMAGKSTALRQTALISVLAQAGSFVPADSASIGIIDKLFTRIGAKDDLFRDRSTFMVEMLETADILRRATPRSLVIMDEVGRGTTVKDGLAIAFATIHHLVTKNQSRCLFATHFHELADIINCSKTLSGNGLFETVRFYCTDVDEIDDTRFVYSYRLRPGVNRDSHGLKVAHLAGLPPSAIQVATNTLAWLKSDSNHPETFPESNESRSFYKSFQECPVTTNKSH